MKLDLNDGFVFSVPYLKDFSLFLKDTYHVVTKDQLMIQGLIYCLCFLYFIFGSPLFPTETFWKINTKEKDDKRGGISFLCARGDDIKRRFVTGLPLALPQF